jgi:hypothetical protein
VFAVHAWSCRGLVGRGQQRGVNGTSGGDGADDYIFDKFATRVRHEYLPIRTASVAEQPD